MSRNEATVLVVDDTPTKLYILSSWLRRSGHQVVQATGGMEALAKVRSSGRTSSSWTYGCPTSAATRSASRSRRTR